MPLNRARSLQIIDPIATEFARNYATDQSAFIADKLLPRHSVNLLSGQYPVFDEHAWFANDVDNKVADRAPTKEIDFTWGTTTYLCQEYGLKVGWTDLEAQQADPAIRLVEQKSRLLSLRMALAREIRVANLLMDSGAGGGLASDATSTPSINWDQATATIETDLKTGSNYIYDGIGVPPNVLVVGYKLAYEMAVNTNIRALLRYDAAGQEQRFIQLGARVLPSIIHGMQVIIAQGVRTTTDPEPGFGSIGTGASVAKSEVWADHARLLYVDPSATWGMPSVGYQITHTPLTALRWRETDPDANYMRLIERQTEVVVAPKAGYVLKNLLS